MLYANCFLTTSDEIEIEILNGTDTAEPFCFFSDFRPQFTFSLKPFRRTGLDPKLVICLLRVGQKAALFFLRLI